LAERRGVDPFAGRRPPASDAFPYKSWPVNIDPPAEGSLDREQFARLRKLLSVITDGGDNAECFCWYSPFATSGFEALDLYAGRLGELLALPQPRHPGEHQI